jgi:hypothetical protein
VQDETLAVAAGLEVIVQGGVGADPLFGRSRRACLLKRRMSRNMPQKPGDSRLRRWANRLLRLLPLYSRPVSGSVTEKLISVGLNDTPIWPSRRMKFG